MVSTRWKERSAPCRQDCFRPRPRLTPLKSWYGRIGEKFQEWADDQYPIPLDDILAGVTLYWLTECYPSSIYIYRDLPNLRHPHPGTKPLAYSYFPAEISGMPAIWCRQLIPGIVRYEHDRGGHFAALEQPKLLFDDIDDFVGRCRHLIT